MVDLGLGAGASRDLDQLVQRFEQPLALAADVGDVETSVGRRLLDQRGELVRVGEARRSVDQRRAHPQGALLHRRPHQGPHRLELLRGRLPVLVAQLMDPHRRRADERRHVGRHAARLQVGEVLAEGGPLDVEADVGLAVEGLLLHRLVERPHRPAFAEHLQRHTLPHVALTPRILEEADRGPAQHVDETRSDDQARHVELSLSAQAAHVTHRHDPIAVDREIADEELTPVTVRDRAAAKHEIYGRARAGDRQQAASQSEANGRSANSRDQTGSSHIGRNRSGAVTIHHAGLSPP